MTRRVDGPDARKDPEGHKQWVRRNESTPLFAPTPADIDAALPPEAQQLATPTPLPKYTPNLPPGATPSPSTSTFTPAPALHPSTFPPTPPSSVSKPYPYPGKGKGKMTDGPFGSNDPPVLVSKHPNGFFPSSAPSSHASVEITMEEEKPNLMQRYLDDKRASEGRVLYPELTGTSAQQQNNANTGGLFGSSTQNTPAQPSGGLFGSTTQQSQAQQSGGLFGSSTTQNQNANASNNTGGLFGGTNTAQQNQGTGSLFGGNTASTAQNQGTGGLFGNATQKTQPQQSGGLFGGGNTSAQQGTGSLFGGGNTNTQQNTGGIFGNTTAQQHKPAGNLFGSTGNSSTIGGTAPNTFSQTVQQATSNTTSSLFGGSGLGATSTQAPRQAPSLLSATQHNQMNQAAPFGRLSMGQAAAAPTTVGAAKVDYGQLLPTTRFEDCIDSVKAELEAVDRMIQQQESWARQIEAFLPKHEDDINSLGPDVEFIKSKVEDVEQALAADAQGVEAQRRNAEKDGKDAQRCQRIITNLSLPSPWQYSNMGVGSFGSVYGSQQLPASQGGEGDEYDTDLIGNYFAPMAAELQSLMDAYANNLGEIENHMRVIEGSAVAQAQQLAQRKAGAVGANPASSDDTVRELAATLRGFEESILGVAGVVGECREGVNQLVLGRLGGALGGMP